MSIKINLQSVYEKWSKCVYEKQQMKEKNGKGIEKPNTNIKKETTSKKMEKNKVKNWQNLAK